MTFQPQYADAFVWEADPDTPPEPVRAKPAVKKLARTGADSSYSNSFLERYGLMRSSIAGKVRVFAFSFTVILVLLGAILGGAQAVLADRSDRAAVNASRAMAASQLATSIAESRFTARMVPSEHVCKPL